MTKEEPEKCNLSPEAPSCLDQSETTTSQETPSEALASRWHLTPVLDAVRKPSYAALIGRVRSSANDPRLQVKPTVIDPRLKLGSAKPLIAPQATEEIKHEAQQPSTIDGSDSESTNTVAPPVVAAKRRVRMQLSAMANNFTPDSAVKNEPSDAKATATETDKSASDKPYLLDPRLKRRRIVPSQTPTERNVHHQPSTMQISLNGSGSAS